MYVCLIRFVRNEKDTHIATWAYMCNFQPVNSDSGQPREKNHVHVLRFVRFQRVSFAFVVMLRSFWIHNNTMYRRDTYGNNSFGLQVLEERPVSHIYIKLDNNMQRSWYIDKHLKHHTKMVCRISKRKKLLNIDSISLPNYDIIQSIGM